MTSDALYKYGKNGKVTDGWHLIPYFMDKEYMQQSMAKIDEFIDSVRFK